MLDFCPGEGKAGTWSKTISYLSANGDTWIWQVFWVSHNVFLTSESQVQDRALLLKKKKFKHNIGQTLISFSFGTEP